ncbi:tRNA pseudouridine(55) synthase TruB [Brumicola blandensis]|jgi:tRNA pseudouridine55 synthase|uniref:tRNA pseudouridine synthase B n=1 Tax=Brumicola blandensis TaxID=3075611 RepID=A0AAW8QZ76_9ALTE|nr:tRNA pseudouridine(55) synthase TruB [Alteromonas sp. W409]MDT0581258.1 tRNA pseudouridine(55) synthase TruB [Alteromonas sp. W409]
MARRKKGRAINGVVLVDKYTGESSNFILQQIKRLYGAAKAGHTGALDPLATGMLPICLGEATKFSQFLLDADKTYIVTAKLGERTDTSDSDGEIIATKPVNVSEAQLHDLLPKYRGDIKQVPSMFSALKYQGKPLYYYARQGMEVPREARDIHIFSLEVLRFENNEVDMQVHCSKGTYIRSLVDDIGQDLGCGAHVTMLRRTSVANYPVDQMIPVTELQSLSESLDIDREFRNFDKLDALLLPMDTAVLSLDEVRVDDKSIDDFLHGQPIVLDGASANDELIRVYRRSDELFFGIGSVVRQDEKTIEIWPKRSVVYREDYFGEK